MEETWEPPVKRKRQNNSDSSPLSNVSAQQHESSNSDGSSSSSSTDEEIDVEEKVKLTDTVIMYPNKRLSKHRNVVAGEICCKFGPRPCVIKFDPNQIVRETEALLKLCGNSNIVGFIDCGTYCGTYLEISYVVMEKYHQLNLEDYVESRTTVPVYDIDRGLKFCKQIIDGMKFVHEKLIIHKDLKPSNILLSHDLENIRIADFGSSQEVKSLYSKVSCPCVFGTLGYHPPESLDGSCVSLKSDIYSLGVVFYFLLSKGKSPFGRDSDKWDHNTQNSVIDISDMCVANPSATEHLIKSMLKKKRCCRPSIWRVECHPCWSRDEDELMYLNFEYTFPEEELHDHEKVEETQVAEEDYCSVIEFLRALTDIDPYWLQFIQDLTDIDPYWLEPKPYVTSQSIAQGQEDTSTPGTSGISAAGLAESPQNKHQKFLQCRMPETRPMAQVNAGGNQYPNHATWLMGRSTTGPAAPMQASHSTGDTAPHTASTNPGIMNGPRGARPRNPTQLMDYLKRHPRLMEQILQHRRMANNTPRQPMTIMQPGVNPQMANMQQGTQNTSQHHPNMSTSAGVPPIQQMPLRPGTGEPQMPPHVLESGSISMSQTPAAVQQHVLLDMEPHSKR